MQNTRDKRRILLRSSNLALILINLLLVVAIALVSLSSWTTEWYRSRSSSIRTFKYDEEREDSNWQRWKERATAERLTQYVDPFIGTGGSGHTYPGATVPFGMVQLSPDNGELGWEWCSGYHYQSDSIVGFSHTHLSGTGMKDLQDVTISPTVGQVDLRSLMNASEDNRIRFSHDDEFAEPGYYSVLLSNGVKAELTATEHTGMHRYTFPSDTIDGTPAASPGIVLNLFSEDEGSHWIIYSEIEIASLTNTSVQGLYMTYGWAPRHSVYFIIEFSKPFTDVVLYGEAVDSTEDRITKGTSSAAYFSFENSQERRQEAVSIMVKVGLSLSSIEGAIEGLRQENPTWDFDSVRNRAQLEWEKELGKIMIDSKDEDQKKTFYTALYHTKLAPTVLSDARGEYPGPDFHIHKAKGFTYYSTISVWDIFRAEFPLLTILNQDRVVDILRTMYIHAKLRKDILPIWPLGGRETFIMPGYHAVVMVAEAAKKGLLSENDLRKYYETVKASSHNQKRYLHFMDTVGFVPAEVEESVTLTLEFGFDDWCSGQIAERLGLMSEANHFYERSKAYCRVFDSASGFMRPRYMDGTWKEPFDPWFSDHETGDFTEGTAWQYLFFVPHDMQGLIELFGGQTALESKLDELFTTDSEIRGASASPDISGMIGQYAHGNEPSHHMAYLYNYANSPHKTQQRVREVMQRFYNATPDGLIGNDDCGQMSAWYVLSSLGFYPVNPAAGCYQLGSPLFDHAIIDVGGGKRFEILAPSAGSKGYKYWSRVLLNGKVLHRTYIHHAEIMAGGTLHFDMIEKPSHR